MTALLDVRNLQVTITAPGGSKPILDDVSFHLAPAEALGLVGESGSGKSTTARAVLGALPPTPTCRARSASTAPTSTR